MWTSVSFSVMHTAVIGIIEIKWKGFHLQITVE